MGKVMLLIDGKSEAINREGVSDDLRQEVARCESHASDLKAEIRRLKSELRLTHQRMRRLNLKIYQEQHGQPALRLVRVG